jgi:hypothetical protein
MWVGYDDSLVPPGQIARGLVRFDLSTLPAGVDIQSARLRLYYMGYWDFPEYVDTITVYKAESEWTETAVNWTNQPNYTAPTGSIVIPANNDWQWYEVDVTGLVRNWISGGTANHGFLLRGAETSGYNASWRAFSTREGASPPELVIVFGGP